VNEAVVESAITAHREEMAQRYQATADYKAHVHGQDGATVGTDCGGYRIDGDFHFSWNWYEIGTKKSDGWWCCNTCFKPVQAEYEHEECHVCESWGIVWQLLYCEPDFLR
jgi:hypothetical protein